MAITTSITLSPQPYLPLPIPPVSPIPSSLDQHQHHHHTTLPVLSLISASLEFAICSKNRQHRPSGKLLRLLHFGNFGGSGDEKKRGWGIGVGRLRLLKSIYIWHRNIGWNVSLKPVPIQTNPESRLNLIKTQMSVPSGPWSQTPFSDKKTSISFLLRADSKLNRSLFQIR